MQKLCKNVEIYQRLKQGPPYLTPALLSYSTIVLYSGTLKVWGRSMILYNPKTCRDFSSQRHDRIGWVKPSPKVSSDQPETFSSTCYIIFNTVWLSEFFTACLPDTFSQTYRKTGYSYSPNSFVKTFLACLRKNLWYIDKHTYNACTIVLPFILLYHGHQSRFYR